MSAKALWCKLQLISAPALVKGMMKECESGEKMREAKVAFRRWDQENGWLKYKSRKRGLERASAVLVLLMQYETAEPHAERVSSTRRVCLVWVKVEKREVEPRVECGVGKVRIR